jgi:hypothetical protein
MATTERAGFGERCTARPKESLGRPNSSDCVESPECSVQQNSRNRFVTVYKASVWDVYF